MKFVTQVMNQLKSPQPSFDSSQINRTQNKGGESFGIIKIIKFLRLENNETLNFVLFIWNILQESEMWKMVLMKLK